MMHQLLNPKIALLHNQRARPSRSCGHQFWCVWRLGMIFRGIRELTLSSSQSSMSPVGKTKLLRYRNRVDTQLGLWQSVCSFVRNAVLLGDLFALRTASSSMMKRGRKCNESSQDNVFNHINNHDFNQGYFGLYINACIWKLSPRDYRMCAWHYQLPACLNSDRIW